MFRVKNAWHLYETMPGYKPICSTHGIIRVIKSRIMRWARHVAILGEERGATRLWCRNLTNTSLPKGILWSIRSSGKGGLRPCGYSDSSTGTTDKKHIEELGITAKRETLRTTLALNVSQTSVSQPLWDRGPVNSFFIRWGPGPNKFTRKYLSIFFLSSYIKLK